MKIPSLSYLNRPFYWILAITIILSSCNAKEENEPEAVTDSLAITAFTIRPNSKILANLDSVFFSIDLKNGVIFNADSLPKGTNISKLGVNITFAQTPDYATIEMIGGSEREGTIDYKSNSSDTLDFTGNVALTIGIGEISKTYRLKVNVHKTNPDALIWDNIARATLPSRLANPVAQKSVEYVDDDILCCIQEADGSYTLAVSNNLFTNQWNKFEVALPVNANIRSFNAINDDLYILDNNNKLYTSHLNQESISAWQYTGKDMAFVIGKYQNCILGAARSNSGKLIHTCWPENPEMTQSEVTDDFPIKDFSNLALISSQWSKYPTAMLAGGVLRNGNVSDAIWGFDGNEWCKLASSELAALRGAALIPYYSYRKTSSLWLQTEFPAWLLLGGQKSDGSYNSQVMISYDNCLNWIKGSELLTLPTEMAPAVGADPIVMSHPATANLADAWTNISLPGKIRQRRLQYETNGYQINWQCPYIYLLGGSTVNTQLQNIIWRGVLARLTFTPLI